MATLSILLADATIIVMPGENDDAVKDMLPIVLQAYQGSDLAQTHGGYLRSKLFFLYNRIDLKQASKMDSIKQNLTVKLTQDMGYVRGMSQSAKYSLNREVAENVSGNSLEQFCLL